MLEFLANQESFCGEKFGWQIDSIVGGHNNRLFRVENPINGEYAIKFTLRDERNRAKREFQTLSVLQQAGLQIAPKSILLDDDSYPLPVVIQTWIDGDGCVEPPQTDQAWTSLLHHYAIVHSVRPEQTQAQLPDAVLTAFSLAEARGCIARELALMPKSAHPVQMDKLMGKLEKLAPVEWIDKTVSLCRCDGNIRNFLQQADQWVSVDWEYSGWGDPAFEIAELLTHPAYMDVADSRRQWVIERYAELTEDPQIESRIRLYYQHTVVWWCVRLARYLYQVPRGLDERLAKRDAHASDDLQKKYQHYLTRAENMEHFA